MQKVATKMSSEGTPPEDRYGVVVALAQLAKAISGSQGDAAFAVASQTAAALLRVPKVVIFTRCPNGELVAGGSTGMGDDARLMEVALRVAQMSLDSASPVVYPDARSKSQSPFVELEDRSLAIMCVPMRVEQSNVGAVVAISDVPRAFTPSDTELLQVVASQAALAAWRKDTIQETQVTTPESTEDLIKLAHRQIQELSLINQVSEAINSTLDLDQLLVVALEQAMMAVEAEVGSLMLINEDTGRLEIVASRGLARKWVERTSQPVGSSIAGWVAEHGESVLVTDAHQDTRFQMKEFRDNISSAASIPLKTKSGVIGVLNVNTGQSGKTYNERDLEILGTIANQMSVAIENARLYARVNRRTKQLDSLLQISRTVTSTLNLDDVMRRLCSEVCKLFQMDVCVLLLLDELSGRLRLGFGSGLKTRRKYAYYDVAAPLASHCKKTGRRMILRNVSASPNFSTQVAVSERLKAAVCIPLKNHGQVLGMAVAFSHEERPFPKSQKDIMGPLGELAGVAISNARIYRQKYRIAQILQQRLVPSQIPQIDLLDIGHKFLPAREVGGDYYDFIVSSQDTVSIVMADVAGSDVEAAEYTTMGKHVLRAYARGCNSPAQVLGQTNSMICEDTRADMFISLFYGTVDLNARKLKFSNAGCEPAVLYKASDKSTQLLTADGILLGIRPGIQYQEREIDLEPGDVLVLYTDGLTEAGVGERRFGRDAVMKVTASSAHLGAQQIADRIHDALLEFVHGRITDDVAMVVVKVR